MSLGFLEVTQYVLIPSRDYTRSRICEANAHWNHFRRWFHWCASEYASTTMRIRVWTLESISNAHYKFCEANAHRNHFLRWFYWCALTTMCIRVWTLESRLNAHRMRITSVVWTGLKGCLSCWCHWCNGMKWCRKSVEHNFGCLECMNLKLATYI